MNLPAKRQRAHHARPPRRHTRSVATTSGCPTCGPNCLDLAALVESSELRERIRELKRALAVALGAEDLAACRAARDELSALLAKSGSEDTPETGPVTVLQSAPRQRAVACASRPVKGSLRARKRNRKNSTSPQGLAPIPPGDKRLEPLEGKWR